MGNNCLIHFYKSIITMKSLVCLLSVVVAASATFLAPPPPPHYRRPGYPGHSPLGGGSIDPMTYLLLTLLGGCTEKHTGGCTQPTVANGDANQKCGMNDQ